jgi:hypothetical protein
MDFRTGGGGGGVFLAVRNFSPLYVALRMCLTCVCTLPACFILCD